ncbi:hypothetical protein HID58_040789 [Brassica napus]|uniref:AT-hook motif nuclear-localized protein n=1 Tax=Brassica napus TaxID=3708 RepID=A0ABQ8B919_BRANA|nr:hypothetical protein HID58_040789 [Brassica napus]
MASTGLELQDQSPLGVNRSSEAIMNALCSVNEHPIVSAKLVGWAFSSPPRQLSKRTPFKAKCHYYPCVIRIKKQTKFIFHSRLFETCRLRLGNLQTLTGTVVSGSRIIVSGSGIIVSGSGIIFSGSQIIFSGSQIIISGSRIIFFGSLFIFSGSLVILFGSLIIISGSLIIFSGYLIISVTLSTLKIGHKSLCNFFKLGKETSESPAERPSNPNQDGKPDDEDSNLEMTRRKEGIKV